MRLVWDETGKRFYEMGVKNAVLYPMDKSTSSYPKGVVWNGLTSVSESPDGAEATDLWADDIKYATFRAAEKFTGSIEAYTYPDEFEQCDGTAEIATGITIGQQERSAFGLSYRTSIGSDADAERTHYKIHLVYGATASPSEKDYETINDGPDAATFSWDFETTPVNVAGHKPTATVVINSRKVSKEFMTALEAILYGDKDTDARLPLPDEIKALYDSMNGKTEAESGESTEVTDPDETTT